MISDCRTSTLPVHWAGIIDDPSIGLKALREILESESALLEQLRDHQIADPAKPYGRNVLLETPTIEVMLATWTRGEHCAPHDHGGSRGLVRVLQGRAHHRIFKMGEDGLQLRHEETAGPGQILLCGQDLIHSMGDDGGDEPLVTLHMYIGPVPHMVVYDEPGNRTLKVDGSCGAWVPSADSGQILAVQSGMVPVHAIS